MPEPKARPQIGVTLAEADARNLQQVAEKEGISVSAAARRAVKSWLAEHTKERPARQEGATR